MGMEINRASSHDGFVINHLWHGGYDVFIRQGSRRVVARPARCCTLPYHSTQKSKTSPAQVRSRSYAVSPNAGGICRLLRTDDGVVLHRLLSPGISLDAALEKRRHAGTLDALRIAQARGRFAPGPSGERHNQVARHV